jgi:hypothetical protein
MLGRAWLGAAMESWTREAPVRIRLTPSQTARLRDDWYYRHANFQELPDGAAIVTFGQDHPQVVLEVLRWLGPGAELLEPLEWRSLARDELSEMVAAYDDSNIPRGAGDGSQ